MITIDEVKKAFLAKIEHTRFIDTLRECERSMVGFYTHDEITKLTKKKREFLQSLVNRGQTREPVNFKRVDLAGVFEVRTRFESVAIIDDKIVSFGCYKTKELAHAVYLDAMRNGIAAIEPKKQYLPELKEALFFNELKNKSIANHSIFN